MFVEIYKLCNQKTGNDDKSKVGNRNAKNRFLALRILQQSPPMTQLEEEQSHEYVVERKP
jgi:hypothetical protein